MSRVNANVWHFAPPDPNTGNERAKCRPGIPGEWKKKDIDQYLALPENQCCKLCRASAERQKSGKPNGRLGKLAMRTR